jgi:putative membrane protein
VSAGDLSANDIATGTVSAGGSSADAGLADAAGPSLGDTGPGWRWLSPRSLIVRPVTDLIRLLPVLLGVLFFGSARGSGHYWGFSFAIVAIVTSMVRYCTTRYRITDERIYLRRGLLNQKVLSVPRDRIRSVDLSAHVIYRILGLRKVMVGTGRNDRREGESLHLDALLLPDAEALRATLLAGAAVATVPAAPGVPGAAGASPAVGSGPADRELARLSPSWVRFAPLTLTGLVIVGVVIGSGSQVIDATHIDVTAIGPVHRLAIRFGGLAPMQQVLDGALIVLALLVLLSVAGYIALFWNFRIVSQGSGALRVSRGLLSTRTTTIDTRRLRGAELSEPLLLRAAGGARCLAITTGLRVGRGAERGGSLLLPPAPRRVATEVAAAVLGVPAELLTGALVAHGPAARRRRYLRAVSVAAVVIAGLLTLWLTGHAPAWTGWGSLVLLPLAAALAADRYRSLGHRLAGDWLITRTGSLVRRRSVLSTDGIIGWQIHQSWFQRRQGLVSLTATTAAGRQHYVAHDIPAGTALALTAAATTDLMTPFLRGDVAQAAGSGGRGPESKTLR